MALRKSPRRSKKFLAASRRNGQKSRGPMTQEGREQARRAHWLHGYFAKHGSEYALLGEDPAELENLRLRLGSGDWSEAVREKLADRLTRVLAETERRERARDGQAIGAARQVDRRREDDLHARMLRLKIASQTLQKIAAAVADRHYVTMRKHLEQMEGLQKESPSNQMSELAVALLQLLRDPSGESRMDERERAERHRTFVRNARAIFGLKEDPEVVAEFERIMRGTPSPVSPSQEPDAPRVAPDARAAGTASGDATAGEDVEKIEGSEETEAGAHGHAPLHDSDLDATEGAEEDLDADYPAFSPEQWEARQPVRQLLYNLVRRQMRGYEAERRELLQQSLNGPTDLERAAEVAEVTPDSLAARKRDELEFRQLSNLLSMLLKLDRRTGPEKAAA